MALSPLAGKPAPKELLIDLAADRARVLRAQTRSRRSGAAGQFRHQRASRLAAQRLVQRGAHRRDHAGDLRLPAGAGHRRTAVHGSRHACGVRRRRSAPRWKCSPPTASRRSSRATDGFTPTPAISRAILVHNRGRTDRVADGIVITPSHNPPEDGGFKYNPPNGGPADTDVTGWIQKRANELLREGNRGAKRVPLASAPTRCDDCTSRTSCCRTSRTCGTSSTWRRSVRRD